MTDQVNPDDYIITRKRKKYRFAKFHNAENCFEFNEWDHRVIDVLEIGAGTGLFSVELAARHPERTYVALDVKGDRLQKGAYVALERGITNVCFVRARADQINELFTANSLQQIWVTFPDPYPKSKKGGRRLTHPNFLRKYASMLRAGGELCLKHDDVAFFHWSLEQLVAEKWRIGELSFDLHDSDLPDEYKVMTTYEMRWLAARRTTNFVCALPPRQE